MEESHVQIFVYVYPHLRKEYDYIEYFAGVGNLTKQMKSAQYRAVRMDLKDHTPPNKKKTNFMDMTSTSGFAFLC